MPRLDLATRAARLQRALAGRDVTKLPKTTRVQLERFAKDAGISPETFIGYAPSTRQKYLRAAKQGRTVKQERERVRRQRKEREKKYAGEAPRKTKLAEIEELRAWLDEHIDTDKGPRTSVDDLAAETLLSRQSIEDHIKAYGQDYVLKQLRGMREGFDNVPKAQTRWNGFKASEAYPDHPDERWYWYHGKLRLIKLPANWNMFS